MSRLYAAAERAVATVDQGRMELTLRECGAHHRRQHQQIQEPLGQNGT